MIKKLHVTITKHSTIKKKKRDKKSECNHSTFATVWEICSTDSPLGLKGVLRSRGWGQSYNCWNAWSSEDVTTEASRTLPQTANAIGLQEKCHKVCLTARRAERFTVQSVKLKNYFWESQSKLLPCHFTNSEGNWNYTDMLWTWGEASEQKTRCCSTLLEFGTVECQCSQKPLLRMFWKVVAVIRTAHPGLSPSTQWHWVEICRAFHISLII